MNAIFKRSVLQIVRRPIYWVGFFILPLFCFMFFTSLMENGIPMRAPTAIVDKDGSSLSRSVTLQLNSMQLIGITESCNSFDEAMELTREGKVFGFFMIPENYEADLLSGRQPVISYYSNMTYFVPGTLIFKTFTTIGMYTKAGVAMTALESFGATQDQVTPLMLPVNIEARAIHNPGMNYAIYLANSFVPGALQLMILLVTCFSLGQEIKYGTSRKLLAMANGSITKALFWKLLPQTIIWLVVALFMEAWLFGINGFPIYGSVGWMTLSTVMMVFATQGLGLFFFGILPNLRMSLSVSALLGILAFSLAAFSFPVESMYSAVGIFSWIYPVRYYFLIYIGQALDGVDIYYSRVWFAAYIVFMVLPVTVAWNIKRNMAKPVYAP